MIEKQINDIAGRKPRDLGLYIHIPFCVKKCDYCDFLSAPADEDTKKRYIDALITEIKSYTGRVKEYIVPTIFIGGGTPSSIAAGYIVQIMKVVEEVFTLDRDRLEATIEVNPGTVTADKLRTYREAGLNRISFGLQSTDNGELKLLGRIHTYEQFVENYKLAREAGFMNINIDLMSALPGQTLSSWEKTLNQVIDLNPEHISAYSLIIEEDTPFYDRYQPGASDSILPDEETDRLIYHRTKEILKQNGYYRYEISNYAKPGYECRHNSSYWIGTEYLGLGLGASSLVESTRIKNMHDMKGYICKCEEYQEKMELQSTSEMPLKRDISLEKEQNLLVDDIGIRAETNDVTRKEQMEEFMFLGLRMCQGVSTNDFFHRFGTTIEEIYGTVIKRLVAKELLVLKQDRICLTDYGIDVSNVVLSEFLLD